MRIARSVVAGEAIGLEKAKRWAGVQALVYHVVTSMVWRNCRVCHSSSTCLLPVTVAVSTVTGYTLWEVEELVRESRTAEGGVAQAVVFVEEPDIPDLHMGRYSEAHIDLRVE